MDGLVVSDQLTLAIDFVTKAIAIFAQRRKGKTYCANVLAEELVRLQMPWVALDPTGAWWGLRAGKNKRTAGLPVIVLGGNHGDIPLDPLSGRMVAHLVVDNPGWYVLDLSLFDTRAEERRFAYEFADALLRYKRQPGNDFPMHLFVDEADMFVPQDKEQGDMKMLGAFQGIVRRGGLVGLGTTLISQRPALVNKSVLVQLDMLILLRLIAGNDQDYVKDNYLRRSGTPEQVAEVMAGWAQLAVGTGWFWEPGAEPEPIFQCAQVRERHTFNSSATPKPGQMALEPGKLARVELQRVTQVMAESIERARADDPATLRARIRELEAELKKVPAPAPAQTKVIEKQIPFIPPELKQLAHDILAKSIDMSELASNFLTTVALTRPPAPTTQELAKNLPNAAPRPPKRTEPDKNLPSVAKPPPAGAPTGLRRAILSVCAQFPDGIERPKLALLAKSHSSSHLSNVIGGMRTDGLVGQGWPLVITDAGLRAVDGLWEPLPSGRAVLDYWVDHFGRDALAGRILLYLSDGQPHARDEVMTALGAGSSSHFSNTLGPLRTADLVAKGMPLRLKPDFLAVIQGA